MTDNSVSVTNNENPTINLEITTYKNNVDLSFTQSIESTLDVHNKSASAHLDIIGKLTNEVSSASTLLGTKVDKIAGKGLSTNDLTNTMKSNYDNAYVNNHTHSNKSTIDALISSGSGASYLANDGTYKIPDTNIPISSRGTISSDFTLINNQIVTGHVGGNYTLTLPSVSNPAKENKCIFDFTTTNTSYPGIVTTGITLKKKDGKALNYSTLSSIRNRLIFTTIDGGSVWEVELQQYGGVETTFVQSTLSANGTLGGTSQAVSASGEYSSSYAAYMASDNNTSTFWMVNGTNGYYTRWNPQAVKANSFDFINVSGGGNAPSGGTIYGSNDNSIYTVLASFTNTVNSSLGVWSVPITNANQAFYNYYKIYFSGVLSGTQLACTQITQNGTYIATS